jgi:hypothetical protein
MTRCALPLCLVAGLIAFHGGVRAQTDEEWLTETRELVIEAAALMSIDEATLIGAPDRKNRMLDEIRRESGSSQFVLIYDDQIKTYRRVLVISSKFDKASKARRLKEALHELRHMQQCRKWCRDKYGDEDSFRGLHQWKLDTGAALAARDQPGQNWAAVVQYCERELDAERRAFEGIEAYCKERKEAVPDDVVADTQGYNEFWQGQLDAANERLHGPPQGDNTGGFREKLARAVAKFKGPSSGGGGSRRERRAAWFDYHRSRRPEFGGIILGNRVAAPSLSLREAIIKLEGQRPAVEVLVQTADNQQKRCRFGDMTMSELWAAYQFVQPGKEQQEKYGLAEGQCALLGITKTDDSREGEENKFWEFAIHPALANTSLAREGMRLDMLIATQAPPPFAVLAGKWETYQWYDEEAVVTARDRSLRVHAAKGPPEALLRVRFWGDMRAEEGAEVPFESGPATAALTPQIDCLHRINRLARIVALLNWIADQETIPYPKLPPSVKPVQMNLVPKMSVAEAAILANLPPRKKD